MPEGIILGGFVHFLAWLLVEIFFESVCYRVGYLVSRVVTFGKWPKIYGEFEILLGCLGLLIILSPFLLYFIL